MVEEGRPRFHRVGHVHPVPAPGEDLALEHRLAPGVLGDVERMPPADHGRIDLRRDRGQRVVGPQHLGDRLGEQRSHRLQRDHPRLDPRRREAAEFLPGRMALPLLGQDRPLEDAGHRGRVAAAGLGRRVQEVVPLEEGIAAEELVRALAGDHHLVAAVPHPPAHVPLGHGQRVVEGAFGVVDHGQEGFAVEIIGRDAQHLLVGLGPLGHLPGDGRLVVVGVLEGDGERLHVRLLHRRGQPEDRAAVDAAGEVAAHRHVGLQPQPHRVDQPRTDAVHELLGPRFGRLRRQVLPGGREVQIPVPPQRGLEPVAAAFDDEHVPRRHRPHALVGGGAGHHHLHRLVHRGPGIQPPRHRGVGEDRLDLRAPDDLVAGEVVVQRLDAEAVADQQQPIGRPLVQGEGELAAKLLHEGQSVAAEQRQGDLAVALRREPLTLARQFGADPLVVVELAVDAQHQVAVGRHQRLPAAGEVDDRQPRVAHRQSQRGVHVRAAAVGAAVVDRVHHRVEERVGSGPQAARSP